MTNNEKMIELFGQTDGICGDCQNLNKGLCSIGRVKVNKHMPACGKFEEENADER